MGVLLVVRHLAARRLVQVAARGEPLLRGVGRLVGVHLVAEEQQDVGAFALGVGGDAFREGVQGVRSHRVGLPPVGGEAQRQEPKEMRARSSSAGVRITDGGNDGNGSRASGHTRSPSTWTS